MLEEIIEKLIEFESRFGSQIFSDKKRLMALIRDYFPTMKREQNLLEKGLELNIYTKINEVPLDKIYLLRQKIVSQLREEHGLEEKAAQDVVYVWLRLVEKQNELNINDYSHDLPKVITNSQRVIKTVTPKIVSNLYSKISKAKVVVSDIKNEIVRNVEMNKQDHNQKAHYYGQSKNIQKNVIEFSNTKPTSTANAKEIFQEAINNLAIGNKVDSFLKFKELAESDFAPAQGIVGLCYYKGTAVKRDYTEAVKWLTKAARNGQSQSQNLLGYCYGHGLGTNQDYKEAVKWYTKAVDQGDEEAQNNLAFCYFNGLGVPKNANKAIELFTTAANKGILAAQVSLGSCYFNGDEVQRDYKLAVHWYTKAAEQGDINAQFNLGECYLKGHGVEKNKFKALKWLSKAKDGGHTYAEILLEDLEDFKQKLEFRDRLQQNLPKIDKERYAKKYCSEIVRSITYDDLEHRTQPSVDDEDVLIVMRSKIHALNISLESEEYPILQFNNAPMNMKNFFDGFVLSTNGIYILPMMKKMKFIYHSNIVNIELLDDKKIRLDSHIISASSLKGDSVLSLYDILYKVWRDFR